MTRLRRSVLYVPGANERAVAKARALPVDAVIFDLEDAVAPAAKAAARDRVAAAVGSGAYGGRELAIRVNGIGTAGHDADLRAAALAGPDGVVVPKVGATADVRAVEAALEAAGAPDRTRIWAMVETPLAVLHAEEIARASERLTVLVLGTNDLAHELHAGLGPSEILVPTEGEAPGPGRQPLLVALQLCLLAGRASGRVVLDGVFNDVADPAGFEAECHQARRLGFDGKTLIHPSQVEACNRAFSPTAAAVDWARRVVAASEEAAREGLGVALVDGRMVEHLHLVEARRVLDLAEPPDPARRRRAGGRHRDRLPPPLR